MTEQHITVRKIEPSSEPGIWGVHTEGGTTFYLNTDEVHALGLTIPAPDLTVTIDGHTVTINRDDAEAFAADWKGQETVGAHGRTAVALADLIRTALEDDTDG